MSGLKRLIQHQRIRVDAHEAGTGRPASTEGLHIDKRFTKRPLKGKWVKIRLVDGQIDSNLQDDDRRSVMREIRDVLKKNQVVLSEFADTVADALARWSSGNITIEKARESASAISKQLGLKPKIEEEIVRRVGTKIEEFLSVHRDEREEEYWLQFSPRAFSAGPGQGRIYKGWEP